MFGVGPTFYDPRLQNQMAPAGPGPFGPSTGGGGATDVGPPNSGMGGPAMGAGGGPGGPGGGGNPPMSAAFQARAAANGWNDQMAQSRWDRRMAGQLPGQLGAQGGPEQINGGPAGAGGGGLQGPGMTNNPMLINKGAPGMATGGPQYGGGPMQAGNPMNGQAGAGGGRVQTMPGPGGPMRADIPMPTGRPYGPGQGGPMQAGGPPPGQAGTAGGGSVFTKQGPEVQESLGLMRANPGVTANRGASGMTTNSMGASLDRATDRAQPQPGGGQGFDMNAPIPRGPMPGGGPRPASLPTTPVPYQVPPRQGVTGGTQWNNMGGVPGSGPSQGPAMQAPGGNIAKPQPGKLGPQKIHGTDFNNPSRGKLDGKGKITIGAGDKTQIAPAGGNVFSKTRAPRPGGSASGKALRRQRDRMPM